MTRRKSGSNVQPLNPALIPLPVVDFIRFEKNLLQMGFFGAHDTRYESKATRRIEQLVNRNGQKIKVSAEFRASQELGLPSTSDRDKYIAFMRIAMDKKNRFGQLSNPIRFTGYRLLKELGLTYAGENYADINRWGQRMADTTITSEQVIYLAARQQYANKTVHVFRSFTRSGQSDLDGSGRTESYEVVLEDWLLENLNQSYVVPEDFNAYRKLKRPTAKGVFGYLHLWFHASNGRQIEKDYTELCILLNIPVYSYVSKIRETMGRSLDELISVGYLSKWDIVPMSTKDGYKLVLLPGEALLHVLAIAKRKQIGNGADIPVEVSEINKVVIQALVERGVSQAKASSLAMQHNPEFILDQIEYTEFLISRDRREKIENPAGLLIYTIENEMPIPTNFVTSRRARQEQERIEKTAEHDRSTMTLKLKYEDWLETRVEEELASRYPGATLARKIKEVIAQRVRGDDRFQKMTAQHQEALALQFIRKDTRTELLVPPFEEWRNQRDQFNLF
jgi:hypothetical protein